MPAALGGSMGMIPLAAFSSSVLGVNWHGKLNSQAELGKKARVCPQPGGLTALDSTKQPVLDFLSGLIAFPLHSASLALSVHCLPPLEQLFPLPESVSVSPFSPFHPFPSPQTSEARKGRGDWLWWGILHWVALYALGGACQEGLQFKVTLSFTQPWVDQVTAPTVPWWKCPSVEFAPKLWLYHSICA